MPDVWELAHGLNPEDAFDGATISLSAEHYTNVELYLNELMGDPVRYKTETVGDVNADGNFSIADVVILQRWLLAVPDVNLADWKAGDLCKDDVLNVFDLCVMKRMLIEE